MYVPRSAQRRAGVEFVSHEAALTVHRLLLGNPASGRLAGYRELEVAALAAHDPRRAAEFIAAILGPLATDEPAAVRLRETLRVYLEEAENAPAKSRPALHPPQHDPQADRAHCVAVLGYPPGQRRLAVELALELRRHLPPTT